MTWRGRPYDALFSKEASEGQRLATLPTITKAVNKSVRIQAGLSSLSQYNSAFAGPAVVSQVLKAPEDILIAKL